MDQAVLEFLSKGTFVLAVLVVIINFFIRRVVQLVRPDFKPLAGTMDKKAMYSNRAAMWWNEIGLYALPVMIGANLGLVKGLSGLFDASIKTTSGRVFYAAVVGWFADFLYEVVQKILYKSTGVTLPSASDLGSSTEVVVVHEEHPKDNTQDPPTPATSVTTTTVTVKAPEVAVQPVDAPPGPAPSVLGGGVEKDS